MTMMQPNEYTLAAAKREVQTLLQFLLEQGVVVTVTQRACKPLAMGNYRTVVEVRSVVVQK
jgi:hypothetical protein